MGPQTLRPSKLKEVFRRILKIKENKENIIEVWELIIEYGHSNKKHLDRKVETIEMIRN